nr:hypothetical protein [Victivallales bacterium]
MTKKNIKKVPISAAALTVAAIYFFPSCRSWESYLEERSEKASRHLAEISARELEEGRIVTLNECLDMAVTNNLDLKTAEIKRKVADKKVTAEVLGMLPDLTITETDTGRNNEPGSSSKNINTGGQTYDYSKSADRYERNFKAEMLFSALDF